MSRITRLHFSIQIDAAPQKVWAALLDDATYREWTKPFNAAGSYYEGEWKAGADMLFLGPDKDGNIGGMISTIKEVRPYEFVSIQHQGEMVNGQKRLYSAEEQGNGLFENYTLTEKAGGTELTIELDMIEDYATFMADLWPQALEQLKQIAERA